MVRQLQRKQQEGSCLTPPPHPSALMPCGQTCLPDTPVCSMYDFISFLVSPPREETTTACLPTANQGLFALPETEGNWLLVKMSGRQGPGAWLGPDLIWLDTALYRPVQQEGWTSEGREGQAGSPCSSRGLLDPSFLPPFRAPLPAWRRPSLQAQGLLPSLGSGTQLESLDRSRSWEEVRRPTLWKERAVAVDPSLP